VETTSDERGGAGLQWADGHWMCVSELMLSLGQADLCGKFTYGAPWLMRSLSSQLDLALARMMRLVASEEEDEAELAEVASGLWPRRSEEQCRGHVDAAYVHQLRMCKTVAGLLQTQPSRMLPTNNELEQPGVRYLPPAPMPSYSVLWRPTDTYD